MKRVYPALPYAPCCLGSLDRTAYMYLRQYKFPDIFSELDRHMSADSDRVSSWDYQHARRCFQEHTGTGELGLETWIRFASDEKAIEFIRDILKADTIIQWTGYRVMGSVHQGNGYPIWTFELFAKHPDSQTKVYTGDNAPNIRGDSPTRSRW